MPPDILSIPETREHPHLAGRNSTAISAAFDLVLLATGQQ
jgi:hypothetical protein